MSIRNEEPQRDESGYFVNSLGCSCHLDIHFVVAYNKEFSGIGETHQVFWLC